MAIAGATNSVAADAYVCAVCGRSGQAVCTDATGNGAFNLANLEVRLGDVVTLSIQALDVDPDVDLVLEVNGIPAHILTPQLLEMIESPLTATLMLRVAQAHPGFERYAEESVRRHVSRLHDLEAGEILQKKRQAGEP